MIPNPDRSPVQDGTSIFSTRYLSDSEGFNRAKQVVHNLERLLVRLESTPKGRVSVPTTVISPDSIANTMSSTLTAPQTPTEWRWFAIALVVLQTVFMLVVTGELLRSFLMGPFYGAISAASVMCLVFVYRGWRDTFLQG